MSLPYTGKQRQDTAIKVKQLQSEEHLCQRKLQLLRKRLIDLEQTTVQGGTVVNAAAQLHTQQAFLGAGPAVREGSGVVQASQQKEVVRGGVQVQGQGQGLVQSQGQHSAGVVPHKRAPVGSAAPTGNSNLGNVVPTRSEPGLQSGGGKDQEREREKRLQVPWQMCSTILKNLLKHKDVAPFAKPVDPVEAGAPDYYKVVSKPMDLGTVTEKLKSPRQYTSPLQFRDDVRQVWKNCRLYNPPGTWIRVTGEKLSDQFEKNWVQKGVEERWFQETGQLDNSSLSSKMIEMGKDYHQKVDHMRKAANKSGRKEATEFEERRKLSQQITQLPGDKLIQVLDLIINLESEYNFEGDKDVVLEISELKVNTIEQLKNLLKRLTNGKNRSDVAKNYNNVNSTQNGDVGLPAPRPPTMPNRTHTPQQREQMQKQATERSLKQQQQVQHSTMRTNTPQQQSYSQKGNDQVTNNFSNTNGKEFHDQNGRSNSESDPANNDNNKDQKDVQQIVDQLIDDSIQQYNNRDEKQEQIQQQQNSDSNTNNTNSSNKRRQSTQDDQQQQQFNTQQQQQANKRQKNTPTEEDEENEEDSNEQDNRSHGTEEDMWEDFKSRDERIREQQTQEGQSQQQQQQLQSQQQQYEDQEQEQQQQQQQQLIPQYDEQDDMKVDETEAGNTDDMDVDEDEDEHEHSEVPEDI